MAKEYFKELQEKIEKLEDGFDIKNIELGLLENELKDCLRPNILLSQLVQFVLQMLIELNEVEQKGKLSPRMLVSKERLLKMLDITSELSGMGDKMQSFKLFNRELVTRIQLLRLENSELKQKLDNIAKAENF